MTHFLPPASLCLRQIVVESRVEGRKVWGAGWRGLRQNNNPERTIISVRCEVWREAGSLLKSNRKPPRLPKASHSFRSRRPCGAFLCTFALQLQNRSHVCCFPRFGLAWPANKVLGMFQNAWPLLNLLNTPPFFSSFFFFTYLSSQINYFEMLWNPESWES